MLPLRLISLIAGETFEFESAVFSFSELVSLFGLPYLAFIEDTEEQVSPFGGSL